MSSLRRGIQIADLLASKGSLGVRAVAQQLGLPIGSVHRILIDLAAEGVVERSEDGSWQLSYRLLAISDKQLDNVKFPRLARSHCEKIASQTLETVNINVVSGLTCVCIDKVRGSEGMSLDLPIGSRSPLYCGGGAKAMLAFMGEAFVTRVLAQPMQAFTANTITTPAALRHELDHVRSRGYAVDDQEMVLGVFCVGVPILDRSGRAIGAISISGPSPKAAGSTARVFVDLLQPVAEEVSGRLGFTGEWPSGLGRKTLEAIG